MRRLLWTRVCALVVLALTASGCGGISTPGVPGSHGIVVVTAGGDPLDSVAQRLPATLELRVVGDNLSAGHLTTRLDGTGLAAGTDGSALTVASAALDLASAHTLHIDIDDQVVFDGQVRVIGATRVMAAEHRAGSSVVVDAVFDNGPDHTVVATALGGAVVTWSDAVHARAVWASGKPGAAFDLATTLPVAHGSRLAAPLHLMLTPPPAPGTLRRVTIPAASVAHPALIAYAVSTAASRGSVAAHAGQLTAVSPTGWRLGGGGVLAGAPDSAEVASARGAHIRATPLVQNDASNAATTHSLVTAHASAAVAAVTAAVRASGVDGIHLDIEGVAADDRDALTAFVTAMASSLHGAGATLDVDVVPHKPGHLNLYSAAYDVPAIAAVADHIVVMAYDQHTSLTEPGPVAGLDWDMEALDGTLTGIDPSHVILGVPLYSRTWRDGNAVADSYAETVSRALAVTGATVDYDFAAATPLIRFTPAGATGPASCYFDDAQSLGEKFALAASRRFAGVALWRLGFEDPALWG